MRYGSSQFDMSHTLTAYISLGNFNTASVTDNTLITYLLILTAVTFPVLAGTKYLLTEQTVLLRLKRSVINRLRLLYLTP